MNTNPVKPGFQSTEFISTVGGVVTVALLALGITSSEVASALTNLIVSAITGVSAIVIIGWIVVEYIKGRKDIKALMIEKDIIPAEEVELPAPPVESAPQPV